MEEYLFTIEDLKLTWVSKGSGTTHYCHEENGRICAKVHEAFNNICSVSLVNDTEYVPYGQYINLGLAKKAVEEMLVNESNILVNIGLK
jgi:hypothetical protein